MATPIENLPPEVAAAIANSQAKPAKSRDPAELWLGTQSADNLWASLGTHGQPKPHVAEQGWGGTVVSADTAWQQIGQKTPSSPQLAQVAEYPDTINPFALAKASDDAWKHLSDSHPWSTTARAKSEKAAKAKSKEDLSVGSAAWQLIKAGILQKGIPGLIPGASEVEDKVVSWGENQLNKLGMKIDLELPDPKFIGQEVTRIRQMYLDIDPKFVKEHGNASLSDPESRIAQAAQEHAKTLYSGSLDHAFPITDAEKALASQLLNLHKMHRSPQEIDEILKQAVTGVAGDIALQQNKHLLFARYQKIGEALKNLSAITEPSKMFVTDLVTSKIVLTDAEEQVHGKRVWGLTPTNLVIRNISPNSNQADNIIIPLSLLTNDKNGVSNGILMASATPDAVDIVRKKAGRVGQNIIFKLSGNAQVGGMVTFYSLERDRLIGEIVVDDPINTIHHLHKLADTIRKTHRIMSDSRATIREQETGTSTTYLRPNIVRQELSRQELASNIIQVDTRKTRILGQLTRLYEHYKDRGKASIAEGKAVFHDPIADKQAKILMGELTQIIEQEKKFKPKELPEPRN